jgi:peptide/nickel transport system permease protein
MENYIAPNTISPLFVQASFIFADAIITEAGLSFLGAGIPAPDPSWGNILSDGKTVIYNAWWMIVFPGIALILSVLSINLLGDGLRDLIDPHVTSNKRIKKLKFKNKG